MPSSNEIKHQQELLDINRNRLSKLVNQASKMGVFAPPYVLTEIDEARANIAQIKATLRGAGIAVEDAEGDEVTTVSASSSTPATSGAPAITIHGGTFHGPIGSSGGTMFNQHYEHVDNVYNIAGSLNMAPSPGKDDFLAALRQFKTEIEKAKDLPEGDVIDLQNDVDSAIRTAQQSKPDKPRLADRLESTRKLLDNLKGSTQSAMALGVLVGELISKLPHLPL